MACWLSFPNQECLYYLAEQDMHCWDLSWWTANWFFKVANGLFPCILLRCFRWRSFLLLGRGTLRPLCSLPTSPACSRPLLMPKLRLLLQLFDWCLKIFSDYPLRIWRDGWGIRWKLTQLLQSGESVGRRLVQFGRGGVPQGESYRPVFRSACFN
jgi:hypothetical protein